MNDFKSRTNWFPNRIYNIENQFVRLSKILQPTINNNRGKYTASLIKGGK